ncbi:hypothetical protein [Streptomyces sp. NPDC007205]|uniref:hypothetical protein n=1 Tax=Streptomyces sp. NPDC007205 TaxID=3154316 RepID=UPI0033CDBEFD
MSLCPDRVVLQAVFDQGKGLPGAFGGVGDHLVDGFTGIDPAVVLHLQVARGITSSSARLFLIPVAIRIMAVGVATGRLTPNAAGPSAPL